MWYRASPLGSPLDSPSALNSSNICVLTELHILSSIILLDGININPGDIAMLSTTLVSFIAFPMLEMATDTSSCAMVSLKSL